jgi:UDP-N-acetyl-D-galactosamine dehydrogenase
MIAAKKDMNKSTVLVMGATFKEDVSDIRNSKVADVITELKNFGLNVHVVDPHASSSDLKHEYGFELVPEIGNNYDAVVVAVDGSGAVAIDAGVSLVEVLLALEASVTLVVFAMLTEVT